MTALSNLYSVLNSNPSWTGRVYAKSIPETVGTDQTLIIVRDSIATNSGLCQ